MSEEEIEVLVEKELNIKDQVDAGWKNFWAKRGITPNLVAERSRLPAWYKKAFYKQEKSYVYVSELEPEELIERAVSRKMRLNWL